MAQLLQEVTRLMESRNQPHAGFELDAPAPARGAVILALNRDRHTVGTGGGRCERQGRAGDPIDLRRGTEAERDVLADGLFSVQGLSAGVALDTGPDGTRKRGFDLPPGVSPLGQAGDPKPEFLNRWIFVEAADGRALGIRMERDRGELGAVAAAQLLGRELANFADVGGMVPAVEATASQDARGAVRLDLDLEFNLRAVAEFRGFWQRNDAPGRYNQGQIAPRGSGAQRRVVVGVIEKDGAPIRIVDTASWTRIKTRSKG